MGDSAGIVVEISNGNECVFKKTSLPTKSNDLKSLVSNLKDMQQKVNACLTTLVEKGDDASGIQNSSDTDLDTDEEEPAESSSKKCKISN